jgi:Ca-activated chloride channel family protein
MAHRNTIHRAALLTIVCALAIASARHARAQGALFKSGIDMVALTVTVTDAAGHCITGLTADHFAVFEDGVQQTLTLFGSEQVPVDVAFVLDTSSSMGTDLPLVKQAARGLVSKLRAGDRAAVVDVKQTVGMPQPFTEDHDMVAAAVDALSARGSTAVYDGLYTALREFQRERRMHPEVRRKALVLLSDGVDNASHVTFEDAAELARQLDVTIYTIALRPASPASSFAQNETVRQADYTMRSLARETGGLAFFPLKAAELEQIYSAIARELVSQYALGYVASSPEKRAAFKRVSVRVLPPAEGRARTRSGYVARASGLATPGT